MTPLEVECGWLHIGELGLRPIKLNHGPLVLLVLDSMRGHYLQFV